MTRIRWNVWKNPRLWLALPILLLLLPFALIRPSLELLGGLLDRGIEAVRDADAWVSERTAKPLARWINRRGA